MDLKGDTGGMAIEYGLAVVHTVRTYGPAIIDGVKQGVTSAVGWGIEGVNTYILILRDYAMQATERIFGSGVAVGGSDAITIGLGDIAGQYKIKKCEEAARAMEKYLIENNQEYKFITMYYPPYPGTILSLSREAILGDYSKAIISENGLHYGIEYNGIVHCNVHPYGLPRGIWEADFWGPDQAIRTITPP